MTPPDSPRETDVEKLRGQLASALGDDYTLGAVLGAGRSGVVFLARNVAANRDVAIKVAWDHPVARSQLARETSLTSAIVHPHVLAMRKLYLAKPIFVIEMPIAPGGTLDNRFQKGGAVSFQYVRAVLRQVAGAFDEAHAMGIVHGSLCPAKILLDENGQCLVSDFGLRVPVLAGAAALHPSELGIPAYTPIEQRYDRGDVDGRVDQYALAIIAYELLRGRRTWHVSREGVVAVEALEVAPNRPIASGVPLSASVAIKRATAREPSHRYPSVADFVRAFSGDTPDAVPLARPERRRRIKGGRAWLLAPIVLALAVVASRPSIRTALRSLIPADWSFRGSDQSVEDEGQAAADTSPLTTVDAGRRSGGDVVSRRGTTRTRNGANAPARAFTPGVISVTLAGGSSAFVVIDGQTRGGTPLFWTANAGRHVVSLRGQDKYSPAEVSVNLAGGDTAHAVFVVTSRR
jgi:serine/threonine protein kinase